MELFGLWLNAIITIVIISIVSCQRIQQSNDNNSIAHLKMEQIKNQNPSRFKPNKTDAVDNIESNASTTRTQQNQADNTNEASDESDEANKPHSRKKRLIWITDDGRLALPPGTVLSITPTLSLPLVRYPLEGFLSNMTMSFPLTIDFDKLGLTDNENPLGVLPPIFARKMGRAAGSALGIFFCLFWFTF